MIRSGLFSRYRGIITLRGCAHSTTRDTSYFSVSRAIERKSQVDLDKKIGTPDSKELVIYNCRRNIDARPRKLNLLAKQIRYLPLSHAVQQMEFSVKKAATSIKEVLVESQEKAKTEHGITDPANLWIAESYVGRGFIEKSVIRHGRGRYGRGRRAYTHYFVIVKEGLPRPSNQRRTREDKTEYEKYVEYQPRIMDSHAWW